MEQLAQRKKKIVIGVSGASGTIYAINLVKKLKEYPMIETHGIPLFKQRFRCCCRQRIIFDRWNDHRTGKYENSRRYLCWFRRQPDCTCC